MCRTGEDNPGLKARSRLFTLERCSQVALRWAIQMIHLSCKGPNIMLALHLVQHIPHLRVPGQNIFCTFAHFGYWTYRLSGMYRTVCLKVAHWTAQVSSSPWSVPGAGMNTPSGPPEILCGGREQACKGFRSSAIIGSEWHWSTGVNVTSFSPRD